MPYPGLVTLGIVLILAGFVISFFAITIFESRTERGSGKGGTVVIVGPFPIIFGSDKQSVKVLLVLSIALVTLLIVLFVIQGYL